MSHSGIQRPIRRRGRAGQSCLGGRRGRANMATRVTTAPAIAAHATAAAPAGGAGDTTAMTVQRGRVAWPIMTSRLWARSVAYMARLYRSPALGSATVFPNACGSSATTTTATYELHMEFFSHESGLAHVIDPRCSPRPRPPPQVSAHR